MATISEIVEVGDGDGAQESLSRLLSHFPKGQRVRILVTEDDFNDPEAIPALDAYFARVAAAREAAPRSPWESTEEAMRELRVAEED